MSASTASGPSVGILQLIRQNSRFRRLWIAQLISLGGDWFNNVAVLGLVLEVTQSGLSASLVLLSSTIPSFFLIPIAGPVVDRFDRRTVMIICNVFSAGVALLFLLVKDSSMIWLVYIAMILLIVSATFFGPASNASIPNVVSREELFSANALGGASWGVMAMMGAALGGLVSQVLGRDASFVINSVSFLIAALILTTIYIPSPKSEKAIAPWRDFAEGIAYLRQYRPALSIVMIKTGWGLAGGVIVLLSVFGTKVFNAGDAGIGFLYSARGMGALVGPLLVQRFAGRNIPKLRNAIYFGFLLTGLGYFVFANAGWNNLLWLGCVALFFAHSGGGVTWIIGSVLLQLTTPDRFRGRVFAVDFGFSTLTTGISTLTFGLALESNISPMVLALCGAVIFLSTGVVWNFVTTRGPMHISDATVDAMPEHLR
jgi:MFS family permease